MVKTRAHQPSGIIVKRGDIEVRVEILVDIVDHPEIAHIAPEILIAQTPAAVPGIERQIEHLAEIPAILRL